MSKLSKQKKEKISEQILSVLLDNFPKSMFASEIAGKIVRDEEFTKTLLQDLKDKELIVPIDKNPNGIKYLKRSRWRLSNKAHEAYSQAFE